MQVNVTRRESEMQLDNNDFDERAQNYRRKTWIMEGRTPTKWKLCKQWKIRIFVVFYNNFCIHPQVS